MKYTLFDKCFITIDKNDIIQDIFNEKLDKHYKRIGSGKSTFICGQKLPNTDMYIYASIEILKKANKLHDYSIEQCGLHTEYHHDGKIKIEYFHNNGIKEGMYKEYLNLGKLSKECYYVNDILNGIFRIYDINGNIKIETTYKNNMIHGKYTEYYNNSTIICHYNEGKKDGEFIREDTKTIEKGIYENNIIVELISTNKNTNIILEKRYKHLDYNENNLICIEIYYQSGNIKEKYYTKLEKKHDKYIKYYESGQIKLECMYTLDALTDKYYEYYESGRLCKYAEFISNIEKNSIQYYDFDKNNIRSKRNNKKYEYYNNDGVLYIFDYNDTPNIYIKYSIESRYNNNNKESYKEILKEFALNLLQSLE